MCSIKSAIDVITWPLGRLNMKTHSLSKRIPTMNLRRYNYHLNIFLTMVHIPEKMAYTLWWITKLKPHI